MPGLSVGRAWTLVLLLPQPSWRAWVTRRGLAVCDTQSPETERKGKDGEEAHALAKNSVNKPCHRARHCPGASVRLPLFGAALPVTQAVTATPRSLHLFTITFFFFLGK